MHEIRLVELPPDGSSAGIWKERKVRLIRTADNVRDYATRAFMEFYKAGCPTRDQFEDDIKAKVKKEMFGQDPKLVVIACNREILRNYARAKDIDAVNKTFRMLEDEGLCHIVAAVRAVYFVPEEKDLASKRIKARVLAHSIDVPADERTVYRWLKKARDLFALNRELCIYSALDDSLADLPLEGSQNNI